MSKYNAFINKFINFATAITGAAYMLTLNCIVQ